MMTFVTGYWPLPGDRRRNAETYVRLFAELHRLLPAPLVVWIDPSCRRLVDEAVSLHSSPHHRQIFEMRFDELAYASELSREASYELKKFENAFGGTETLAYAILTWSKPFLVAEAIRRGHVTSSHAAWIDFGISHVADISYGFDHLVGAAPSSPGFCEMRATTASEIRDLSEFHRFNRGKVAAGLLVAPSDQFADVERMIDEEVSYMRDAGRLVLEENLLGAMSARRPGHFVNWYGDYIDLVRNYGGRARGGLHTILDNLTFCRDRGMHEHGVDIVDSIIQSACDGDLLIRAQDAARLLHDGYICTYYSDRDRARELARVLILLHQYGTKGISDSIQSLRPLLDTNLDFIGERLDRPTSWSELSGREDFAAWRHCL